MLSQGLRLGDRVQGLRFGDRVQGLRFGDRVQGLRFGVQGLRFGDRVQGLRFGDRVQGLRCTLRRDPASFRHARVSSPDARKGAGSCSARHALLP